MVTAVSLLRFEVKGMKNGHGLDESGRRKELLSGTYALDALYGI